MTDTRHRDIDRRAPHPFAYLRLWRERAGLTQEDVGAELQVTDVTIHRWENGKAPVTVSNFIKLAHLYRAGEPGALMFHPDDAQVAKELKAAAQVLTAMTSEDRARWLDIGRRLATPPASSGVDD